VCLALSPGDFPETKPAIVRVFYPALTMGVAAEVIQWFEFAKDGDVDGVAEGLLHFVEGGDPMAQQKRAQCGTDYGDTS